MFSSVRGIPAWAAVLLVIVLVGMSYAFDWGKPVLGRPFTVLFSVGCVAAVLFVKRKGLFWPSVIPPIVALVMIPLFYILTSDPVGDTYSKAEILTFLVPLAKRFPLVLATWLIVLAIALVRGLVLEPSLRRDRTRAGDRLRQRLGTTRKRSKHSQLPRHSAASVSRAAAAASEAAAATGDDTNKETRAAAAGRSRPAIRRVDAERREGPNGHSAGERSRHSRRGHRIARDERSDS